MTPRERFLAFAAFEPVDRILRRADFVPEMNSKMTAFLGAPPSEHFSMDKWQGATLAPPAGYVPPDYTPYYPGKTHGQDGFSIDGNGVGHQSHGFYHFTEYISPLRQAATFDELERFPIPEWSDWGEEQMVHAGNQAHAAGMPAGLMIGHMYENAWQIRGYEEFLMDLLTRRDWAEYLLDAFCRRNEHTAIAAARAGYDLILTGDDVANQNSLMFTPELWRTVFKPRWAGVYAAARAIKPDIQIWYHSDGNIEAIIDDLVEIGVTILNPVQPECMNPAALRRRYGKRLAFDGCVGTQTTFPFGSREEMKNLIHGLAKELDGGRGGLMLSPTHVLEPEVPPENVLAFFQACDEVSAGFKGNHDQ